MGVEGFIRLSQDKELGSGGMFLSFLSLSLYLALSHFLSAPTPSLSVSRFSITLCFHSLKAFFFPILYFSLNSL